MNTTAPDGTEAENEAAIGTEDQTKLSDTKDPADNDGDKNKVSFLKA